jgi:hypothetical protein
MAADEREAAVGPSAGLQRDPAAHGAGRLQCWHRPEHLSFKHTVQQWTEWVSRGVSATQDDGRLFTMIAQCRVGNRPGRIEPRMRKRRPKSYPWLKIARDKARRKIERYGRAWETK